MKWFQLWVVMTFLLGTAFGTALTYVAMTS